VPSINVSLGHCMNVSSVVAAGCPMNRLMLSINALSVCFDWVVGKGEWGKGMGNGDSRFHLLALVERVGFRNTV